MSILKEPMKEDWITVKEAGAILGGMSDNSVIRLGEEIDPATKCPYLKLWRPSRRVVRIDRQSVLTHKHKTQRDPYFWETNDRAAQGEHEDSGYFTGSKKRDKAEASAK